ncbi:MAG TPA: hypothetical protein VFB60_16855 [Ktedonobacteraceae bacterium]|nr:hypothetical protein [Ktedonobacteraceae bacterium]
MMGERQDVWGGGNPSRLPCSPTMTLPLPIHPAAHRYSNRVATAVRARLRDGLLG